MLLRNKRVPGGRDGTREDTSHSPSSAPRPSLPDSPSTRGGAKKNAKKKGRARRSRARGSGGREERDESQPIRPRRPPARGWLGPGRGSSTYIQAPGEWRGTTVQVCGLWPFAVGTGTPMVGVPLGRHIQTSATLCCDPISWFQRAKLISNPSCFVLGKPGLGKSTCVRRMALGLTGYGVMPLVLGDLKPDYVDLIEALGGQVITLGRGRGYLNILDPGEAVMAAEKLRRAMTAGPWRSSPTPTGADSPWSRPS